MKKLLIINHYAGAPKYGMEYRHYNIAKELVLKGVEVCIIASSYSHLRKEPDCREEMIDGIQFKWIKTPSYQNFGIKRLLNMIIFSVKMFFTTNSFFHPDTILISSPSPFPILNSLYLKRKYKAKLIYEIRDVWPQSLIELKGMSKYNPLILFLNWLDFLGIKYADFIMSPLAHINLYLKEKGFDKKVIIVPNGISTIKINKDLTNQLNASCFVVGYGGTLGDSNSIMNLLEAALLLKENKGVKFKIVGGGEKMPLIRNFISENQLDNVKLYGRVDQQNLFEILNNCDVLYKGNPKKSLYKYGISSIKMVEYLLLRKPIIDASYGVDIVGKSNSGITVLHENSEDLVNGILEFKQLDKKALTQMGENGFEYVKQNYLYSASVQKMLTTINREI